MVGSLHTDACANNPHVDEAEDVAAELESTLRNYVKISNHNIPQRASKHQTPIQALKNWQQEKPDLFVKRVYKQTGLDT